VKTLALLALLTTVSICAGHVRGTSAAFTASSSVGANGIGVDALRKHVSLAPGALATGDADSLSIDLGLVPSPQTVASAFTVSNPTTQAQSVTLALTGASQVSAVTFASSGTTAVALAPGASTAVRVTTSPTVAGRGAGTIRLALAGSTWLYRDYPIALDAAPSAPAALTAVARAAGVVRLTWPASATTTNLAGYDVYRSIGGAYVKVNSSTLTATTFDDSATVDGTTYSYRVRATSSGTPSFASLDSPTATAVADATPPALPTSVSLANGGGNGNAYVNAANVDSVSVSVTLPTGALASDVVTLTVSNGAASVTATAASTAGAGTVTFAGLNLASLGDGTLTFAARATDAAGNVSSARSSTATKDTAAPGMPTAAYVDNKNAADHITGTAEAGATIVANQTAPAASGPYTATATSGSYDVTVAVAGKNVTVTYTVTATDAAGNRSAAATLTFTSKN
jgi:hypothetical protein